MATAGETVEVDSGTYAELVTLSNGKSLVATNFDGVADGTPVIGGGADPGFTIIVSGSAGTIGGLTIRGDGGLMSINGPVTVSGNTFDEGIPSPPFPPTEILVGLGPVTFQASTFSDPTPATIQTAIPRLPPPEPRPSPATPSPTMARRSQRARRQSSAPTRSRAFMVAAPGSRRRRRT